MTNKLLDVDLILQENEQWTRLDEEWGNPVDLDVEEDVPAIQSRFSSLDLRKSTFDSSFLFKKVRRKVGRQLSKRSANLNYDDFKQDLQRREKKEKDFYFINGQIISAVSVEEICETIDDVFRSIEKLCSATSTMKRSNAPKKVECSISTGDLSFDDSTLSEKEVIQPCHRSDGEDIDRYIDEAFDQFSCTIRNLSNDNNLDDATKESVTTLVRRFSSILNSPNIKRSPRRQKCCNRFKELADFWQNQAFVERDKS
ncbi:hypothetical protein K1T71_004197 [Dendrolimus kikuchii]|uniref:Uncharacterized protein n=1 Tax=Dendrolimus kikuchii TaxID=765133 RepID=A0ACC1DB15_9NEOP|nr:hypothetical protein K1T71_004197 [Dendrolimus kikuchii]